MEASMKTTDYTDNLDRKWRRVKFDRLFAEYQKDKYGISDFDHFTLCQLAREFGVTL
jgi:hypothetical protein